MKISIVTPSYNQGQFIEDAILSVLNQGYHDFEHIIIDGGSSDNSVDILKKFSHLIWISEPDEGQSDAINKGFRLTTGDIVGWLNADDIYLPNIFLKVASELSKPGYDAIYGNFRFIDSSGSITRELRTQKSKKWMSLLYCFIPSTTFFFKRNILEKEIFIDKKFHIAMDKEFFARIYYSGFKIKKINEYFAHFRWHDNNKSIDTKAVQKIRLKEGLEIFNRYSGFKLSYSKAGIFIYKSFLFLCGTYRTFSRFFKIGIYGAK